MSLQPHDYLRQARFYTDDEPYLFVQLPVNAITVAAGILAEIGDPFTALIVDKDEVTLVVPHEATEEFAARLRDHKVAEVRYRLITVDVVMPLEVVGFIALLTAALAGAGIPVMTFASYSRDHLLVPEDRLSEALATLSDLKTRQN